METSTVGGGEGMEGMSVKLATEEVTLFSAWFCPFAQRAWIALEEKKVKFRCVEVDPYAKPAELMAANPRGLVPAIVHKGKGLFESMVVVEYVDEAFPRGSLGIDDRPRGSLMPLEPYDRALARIWIDHIGKKVVPTFYRVLQTQDPKEQDEAKADYLRALKELSMAMVELSPTSSFFMGGEQLGIVDIALAPWVAARSIIVEHYRNLSIPPSSDFERLRRWRSAVLNHPSVKATLQDEDKLIQIYKRYATNEATSQVAVAIKTNRPLP
ncbi:hypothetical protein CBR_g30855 [Chara braunii]|uniref:Glutathione transferase n=1 Tax=Chara braunii TaxID=69332 RepID=A0A388JXN8_CHABU|nr:hypothetical protein CBR_g30855 [Chara braunii]|eukprot:GBG62537.1 hypothetical protein CBR_g30855 [Chara braunii]